MAIINTDKQVWILTTYGIERIQEVMASAGSEKLYISKIKIGDANGSYYVPVQGTDNDLRHPIVQEGERVSFPVNEKTKDGTTVTFRSFISELSGGYTIREIALYETINEVDYCFALGTCEPIVKPAYDPNIDYGYAMSIDYKLNINSVNLSSVYDQIELDADNEYITKEMLDALARTVLFVEGNLMDQISIDSHLLGLNRAQQLADLIETTQDAYANASLTSLYANIINAIDGSHVKGFWGFNYTEKYDSTIAVKDFSPYGHNLNLNKPITNFETGRFSIAPYTNFTQDDYFYAQYIPAMLMDSEFTVAFTGQINNTNETNTILAQANPYTSDYNWSIQITPTNAVQVKIYTDKDNYKTYTSAHSAVPVGPFTLLVTYKNYEIKVYLNQAQLSMVKVTTGSYGTLAQNHLSTTSYVLDSNGQKSDNLDSKITFLALFDVAIDDLTARAMSYNLMSMTGYNIYRGN